jgi:peptidyl-prolyl cis-trans isomerase C
MSRPAPISLSRGAGPRRFLRRVEWLASIAGTLVLAAFAGCGAPAQGPAAGAGAGAVSRPRVWNPGQPDTLGPVVAIIGRQRITRHDVDSILATAPPDLQQKYRTSPEEYRTLVERVVATEAVHQAALHDSVQNLPGYRAELARVAHDLALKYYYQRQMRRAPGPSDSAVTAYYNEHLKDYYTPGRARVHHILLRTRAQANAARRRLVGGATWASVCAKESRDTLTAKNEGILGYVATESDIAPGLGKDPEFVAAALALKEGEISQPVRTARGWHLLMVDDRREPSHSPLAEVQNRIKAELQAQINENFSQTLVDSLKDYFGATIFDDSIKVALEPERTPQQIFEQAQASPSPSDRIDLYRQLIARFPKERVSEQAAFMVGFTYAEEVGDSAAARAAFEEFIKAHPKSDLVSSAKWMLENMTKPNPPFEGETPPDSLESPEGE